MTNKESLYDVSSPLAELLEKVEAGEIESAIAADTIDSLLPAIKEKGLNVSAYIQNREAEASALKDAERKIRARRDATEKRIKWLKEYLLENMVRCGIEEISCPEFVVRVANNPPRICTGDNLPKKWLRKTITYAPDKAAIKAALNEGKRVRGAKLEQGKRLVFK